MKKILLVEDNETIIMGLKYSLEQENFQVISAKSVAESKEKIKIGILFGIYGKLLTEKQYELLNDYYNNDLSLSEIAENNNITRQAVNDVINKGKNKLIEIEEKLAFMKKMLNQEKEIKLIINELKNAENKTLKKEQIQDIQKRLEQLI